MTSTVAIEAGGLIKRYGERTVVAVDSFGEQGDGRAVREERAAALRAFPKATVVTADLTLPGAAGEVFRDLRPAAVVNAAVFPPGGPGVVAMLEAIRGHEKPFLVHLSDAALYGAPGAPGQPAHEDEPADPGRDPVLLQRMVEEARLRGSDVPNVILRLFDVLAPGAPANRFPQDALEALLDGDEVVLPSDAPRDLLHVRDAVHAILAALADAVPVAIVSGRDLRDIRKLVGIDSLIYAGSHGFEIIRDQDTYASIPGWMKLPEMELRFVQGGSYLVPVTQGLVYSGNPYWNYIIGPGRIWHENGDGEYARASFPFTLVERNQNCTHNGVMTFLFDGRQVSDVHYQVTQETCVHFKFDLWGQASATYIPESIPGADSLIAAHEAEVANRLPTRPITALEIDFPDAGVNLLRISSGITPGHMSAYGLVINGINYVSACKTRHGEYPFCESLRLPSYSTAKSVFAGMALMRLAQKYGEEVADLTIAMGTGQLKTGAPCRSERVEKYNQLMRIEEELGTKAAFSGRATFRR